MDRREEVRERKSRLVSWRQSAAPRVLQGQEVKWTGVK